MLIPLQLSWGSLSRSFNFYCCTMTDLITNDGVTRFDDTFSLVCTQKAFASYSYSCVSLDSLLFYLKNVF